MKFKLEPVRIYAIVAASVALAAHYVQSLPVPLVLGLAAAVIGAGEVARGQVTPNVRVPERKELVVSVVPDLSTLTTEDVADALQALQAFGPLEFGTDDDATPVGS